MGIENNTGLYPGFNGEAPSVARISELCQRDYLSLSTEEQKIVDDNYRRNWPGPRRIPPGVSPDVDALLEQAIGESARHREALGAFLETLQEIGSKSPPRVEEKKATERQQVSSRSASCFSRLKELFLAFLARVKKGCKALCSVLRP